MTHLREKKPKTIGSLSKILNNHVNKTKRNKKKKTKVY
jgi:hypothetical protein